MTKNTGCIIVCGRARIPDFVRTGSNGAIDIAESKNVAYLSYTAQIRDYERIVRNSGGTTLDIYVRRGDHTRVSAELMRRHNDPRSPINIIGAIPY